jgi:NAD(P)-dependent dehydrogenase (short-subunit alcohol dehydrogenase family)
MGASNRRFALVTGTSSGIGAALARLLLERGWTVCGVARRPTPIEHALYEHVALDLGQVGELDAALGPRLRSRLSDAPSRVGLVNNAASADLLGPVEDIDPVRVQAVLTVNTVAPMVLTALISRSCPPHAALRVVNVSSAAAVSAFPGLARVRSQQDGVADGRHGDRGGVVVGSSARADAPEHRRPQLRAGNGDARARNRGLSRDRRSPGLRRAAAGTHVTGEITGFADLYRYREERPSVRMPLCAGSNRPRVGACAPQVTRRCGLPASCPAGRPVPAWRPDGA